MKKTVTNYTLGIPVVIHNCPHFKFENEWVADILPHQFMNWAYQKIIYKDSPWTGSELKFLRHHKDRNLQQWADFLDDVKSVSQLRKYESKKDERTGMPSAMERSIRLQLIKEEPYVHLTEVWKQISAALINEKDVTFEYYEKKEKINIFGLLSGPTLVGTLSNEASQDSEGNPVYVFLDATKYGYDAFVLPQDGDHLKVFDKKDKLIFDDTVSHDDLRFIQYMPQLSKLKAEWFDGHFKAHLTKKKKEQTRVKKK